MDVETGATKDVAWLHLDLTRLPQKETLEYSIKKSLLAASAVFEFRQTDGTFAFNARAEGKIPFKGNFVFTSEVRGPSVSQACSFSQYSEIQQGKAARHYVVESDALQFKKEGEATSRKSIDLTGLDSNALMASIMLPHLLSSWIPNDRSLLASQFVVAGRILAVKVQLFDMGRDFRVYTKEVDAPINLQKWLQIEWPTTQVFEGSWSDPQKAVSSLRFKVPVLGTLELPLVHCDRG